jgi:beta-glucosidase
LRNVYLPPFAAAVKAGAATFMSAYMDLNDVPASGNRFLLRQVLREEWGFDGFVVSDAFAVGNMVIQGHARDGRDAALRASKPGLNMDMASYTYTWATWPMLVEDGALTVAEIEELVRPILALKVKMGLFERPYVDETLLARLSPGPNTAPRRAGPRSARWCCCATKGGLLPLSQELKKVAVIGPLADSMSATEGSWMVFGHQPAAVTVLAGIRARLPTPSDLRARPGDPPRHPLLVREL